MNDFKVIITGDRDFNDYDLLKSSCDKMLHEIVLTHNIIVICGKEGNINQLVHRYALDLGFEVEEVPLLRESYAKYAHYVRAEKMTTEADALIAFHDGVNFQTSHLIALSASRGLDVRVFYYRLN